MGDPDDLIQKEVGSHLRRRRETLGLTQEEVASRASAGGVPISASKLSRVEKGTASVSIQVGSAVFHSLGSNLSVVDEIARSARARKVIDLTETSFDGLLEEGKAHLQDGQILGSLDYFEAAHDWVLLEAESPDRNERLAQALIWEADCYFRLGSFSLALQAAARPLDMTAVSTASRLRVLLLHVNIYRAQGALFQAELYAKEAQASLNQANSPTRAFALGVIGRLRGDLGDHRGAIEMITRSREEYRALGRENEVARANVNVSLGECHYRAGHPDNGFRLVNEGYRVARAKRYREVEAVALRVLGLLHSEKGDPRAACSFFERGAKVARGIGHAVEEFLAWFGYWKACLEADDAAGKRKSRRVLRSLLPRVGDRLPEVAEVRSYLEAESSTFGGRKL